MTSISFRILPPMGRGKPKYELTQCVEVMCLYDFPDAEMTFLRIRNARMYFEPGFLWDGPSGPIVDTVDWMVPSLAHDGLYELMRAGKIPLSFRRNADRQMAVMLKDARMSWIKRVYSYLGVRIMGGARIRRSMSKRGA